MLVFLETLFVFAVLGAGYWAWTGVELLLTQPRVVGQAAAIVTIAPFGACLLGAAVCAVGIAVTNAVARNTAALERMERALTRTEAP